ISFHLYFLDEELDPGLDLDLDLDLRLDPGRRILLAGSCYLTCYKDLFEGLVHISHLNLEYLPFAAESSFLHMSSVGFVNDFAYFLAHLGMDDLGYLVYLAFLA